MHRVNDKNIHVPIATRYWSAFYRQCRKWWL